MVRRVDIAVAHRRTFEFYRWTVDLNHLSAFHSTKVGAAGSAFYTEFTVGFEIDSVEVQGMDFNCNVV